ncbi:N-acylphosphatidylethanolamine synthase isoform X2 [Amaranthus tricolor]|uniref:N-acylphosphatidylethanolamine synthase isoform X2 n=1 Tax=Amaranthus tricolor TaxID=29722 RepID=UPI0025842B59|nr:N-acylphosphatidylethanolamine synthase isoform X2 [Amaranthus tricolor]
MVIYLTIDVLVCREKSWDDCLILKPRGMARGRTMEFAARGGHLGGIPRKLTISAVGSFAKVMTTLLNNTSVHNGETLLHLVRSRPLGVPLLTVSNHMSTLDDPLMWGFKGFPVTDAKLARWVLAAEDICFKNTVMSYFFRLGKCIPISRGGGVYQKHMDEALERLTDGEWLHTFPEGKVSQQDVSIRRLKWGTASLIARAPLTPIVLPIVHHGFHKEFELVCMISLIDLKRRGALHNIASQIILEHHGSFHFQVQIFLFLNRIP